MPPIAEQARLVCPSCKASIRIDLGNRRKKMQCPRCLNTLSAVDEPMPDPVAQPADLEALRHENASLRLQLENAVAALRDSSALIDHLANSDSRIATLGTNYVRAIVRLSELEEENKSLRQSPSPPEPPTRPWRRPL